MTRCPSRASDISFLPFDASDKEPPSFFDDLTLSPMRVIFSSQKITLYYNNDGHIAFLEIKID